MTPMKATILGIGGVMLLLMLCFGGCGISAYNQEADLRTAIVAKNKANETTLDTMWKIIQQKAQISEEATNQIKDMNKVYSDLVSGRSGGALFKMVTENYPDLGQAEVAGLYKEIMVSVEAERKVYKRDQQALIDIDRERNLLLAKFIESKMISLFGGDTTPFIYRKSDEHKQFLADGLEPGKGKYYLITVVTSKKTQSMIEEAAEDDIDLFKKDKPAETE